MSRSPHLPRLAAVAVAASLPIAALAPAPSSASGPPRQPVAGGPRERSEDLPFGQAKVSGTRIVAGAPEQTLDVVVRLAQEIEPGRQVIVRLYRPQLDRSADDPDGQSQLVVGSRRLDSHRRKGKRELGRLLTRFSDLDPPAGAYRLDFLVRKSDGSKDLVGRLPVTVTGQNRLPLAGAFRGDLGSRSLAPGSADYDLSAQAGAQAEAYVAAVPTNQARVIAGVNPTGSDSPSAWISDEFMRPGTAVRRTFPASTRLPSAEGGGTVNSDLCCDPSAAADELGNLWFAVLTLGNGGRLAVNRVAAGTDDFQSKSTGLPRRTTCTDCQDKPLIGIDDWPDSPKRGTLYAVWTENKSSGGQNIVITQCATRPGGSPDPSRCDDPDKWSAPVRVTDDTGSYTYAAVAAAPSGDVYVVWQNYASPKITNGNSITGDVCDASKSCTSKRDWGKDEVVEKLDKDHKKALPFFCPIQPAPAGRLGPSPFVEVDSGGRVYVEFGDLRDNGSTRCQAQSSDQTWDSYVAAGSAPDQLPTPGAEVRRRLSDDSDTASNHHFFATLAVDPQTGEVQSSLYSTKADPNRKQTHQYVVESTDHGDSYGPMTQITSAPSDFSGSRSDDFDYGDYEGSDSAGGLLYPVWTDNRSSNALNPDMWVLAPPQSSGQLAISPTGSALPGATEGSAYSQALTPSGGTAPYHFTIGSGALPSGLSLSDSGQLTGTPDESGDFALRVDATDSSTTTGSRFYTLHVAP